MGEYKQPSRPPDIEAEVTLLPTEQGGRRNPVSSGYRPTHDFGVEATLNDAVHEYPDLDQVVPGETARALLWLARPEMQKGRLHRDFEFTIQEGPRVVGRGRVLQVLNESLRRGV